MSDMNNWADKMEQDLAHANERARDAEHKAQQLQAELAALTTAHAWIKTSERVPNKGETVLAKVSGDSESALMILVYMPSHNEDPMPWRLYGTYAWFNSAAVLKWAPIPRDRD